MASTQKKIGKDYKVISKAIEEFRESYSDNELTNLEILV
jgi:hypothetical protein